MRDKEQPIARAAEPTTRKWLNSTLFDRSWELLHAPSVEAALIDVVNRGGDADANGAIAGALLGAVHGERAIPARWRRLVLHALEHAAPSALRDIYHPGRLLDLVP